MKVVKNFNLKVFTILTLANIGFYTHLYSQDSTKTLPEKHLNLSVNDEFDKLKLITQKLSDVFLKLHKNNYTTHLEILSFNHKFVDIVSEVTHGANISVYKNTAKGLEIISNSLCNEKRDIGLLIPNNTELTKTIRNHKTFNGELIIRKEKHHVIAFPIQQGDHLIGAISIHLNENILSLHKQLPINNYPLHISSKK